MDDVEEGLSAQVVATEALSAQGGSGNPVERVTLRDGRVLIRKRVSPAWDWISRATGDSGRALAMWRAGLFARVPTAIRHATVAVEEDDDGWVVFMEDVSRAMVAPDARLDRAQVRRVLGALAALHEEFRGERFPDLCSIPQRYHLASPATGRREVERGDPVLGDLMIRGWDVLAEMTPRDVADAVLTLAERPELLAAELDRCEPTLVHGDVRLANLGFDGDSVVLIDWGERTGSAPAPVDLASFLVFDARRFDVSRDDVVADFREIYAARLDETALQLALIGGLVQLGTYLVLEVVLGGGDAALVVARRELEWWTATVRHAFEHTWSPI